MSSPSWRAHHEEDLRKDELMKLTTNQQVSVDGVVENNGRWARSQFDSDAMSWNDQAYQRGDARLFPDNGPDLALDLIESRAFPKGITLQVYRPAGRPQYATDSAE